MAGSPDAPALLIRPAEDRDADDVVRVYLDSAVHHVAIDPVVHELPDPASVAIRIAAKLADAETRMFVAEESGQVVGLVELKVMEPPPRGSMIRSVPTAHLGIAVRADRRDRGIGGALMTCAETWARAHGCEAVSLDMSAANDGARRFYERLGYGVYGLLLRKELDAEE